MHIALGLIIGMISGTIQFFMLSKFTGAISQGKVSNKTVLFALTQFLFPFAVLVICAFFIQDSLMWAGIGMGAALITSAVVKFLISSRTSNVKSRPSAKK
ncbi:MAG: hypothetical protein FWC20_00015 [Oscillospiraceae bacterium]|nr:hypothetical protein [Oscillospiraceae bacterium]MCL2277777.1 hypothetical protein [Oscillospiraceae bacterium]